MDLEYKQDLIHKADVLMEALPYIHIHSKPRYAYIGTRSLRRM